jgi:hypothetical protein
MNVDHAVEAEWMAWMKQIHVPDVLKTGCFVECKIFKLMSEESEGTTYSFQYFAEKTEQIVLYQEKYGAALQADVHQRYGDKVMSFRSLLKQVG